MRFSFLQVDVTILNGLHCIITVLTVGVYLIQLQLFSALTNWASLN